MDNETIIRLAKEAGLVIYRGEQDRLLYEGSIIDALARFADLAKGNETTIRVSLEDSQFLELRVPDAFASPVIDAIKDAFKKGQESASVHVSNP